MCFIWYYLQIFLKHFENRKESNFLFVNEKNTISIISIIILKTTLKFFILFPISFTQKK
jgi:hypothetical protein